MDNNTTFRIISVFENSAERDYLNAFLKFVGLFTYYDTLEDNSNKTWQRTLFSEENKKGIDIVINYYGYDLYTGVKNKVYLYFDFDSLICGASSQPLKFKEDAINKFHVDSKKTMRRKVLEDLINSAFPQNVSLQLLTVLDAYVPQDGSYNLYLATQIAYGLSVLSCKETEKVKELQIKKIFLSKYLETLLQNLSNSYQALEKTNNSQNIYSLYMQIQIALIKNMIVAYISSSQINENCVIIPMTAIYKKLKQIYILDPLWISYFLCEASLLYDERKSDWYLTAFNIISDIDRYKIAYASISYGYGKLIEKHDYYKDRTIMHYNNAYKNNPTDYRALFAKTLLEISSKSIGIDEAKFRLATAIKQIFANHSIKNDDEFHQIWKNLSLTDSFYVWRFLILTAQLDMSAKKEYTIKTDIRYATIAASYFEYNGGIRKIYDESEEELKNFLNYHQSSTYTWILWKILELWSHNCRDTSISGIVNSHLRLYTLEETEDNTQLKRKYLKK